jgi:hypothetical protein
VTRRDTSFKKIEESDELRRGGDRASRTLTAADFDNPTPANALARAAQNAAFGATGTDLSIARSTARRTSTLSSWSVTFSKSLTNCRARAGVNRRFFTPAVAA